MPPPTLLHDINNSAESLWKNAEQDETLLAKLQIGNFFALFPAKPYVPDGFHFMVAPRSNKFETIESVGRLELEKLASFLLPALKNGAIIGYNEASDMSIPSAKSWKNLHLHVVSPIPKTSEQRDQNFNQLFRITNETKHNEFVDVISAQMSEMFPEINISTDTDHFGVDMIFPFDNKSAKAMANIVSDLDQRIRQLTNDMGCYVVAAHRLDNDIALKIVPTTYIEGIDGKRFGFMEASGYSVSRFQKNEAKPSIVKLKNKTEHYVHDLLSKYFANNFKISWDDWYSIKKHIPAEREREQETRHRIMFKEIIQLMEIEDLKQAIEIGVGSGTMLKILKKLSKNPINTIGIDLSRLLLAHTREISKNQNLIETDTFALPFSTQNRNNSIIFHQGLIEHFNTNQVIEMLQEQLRVAKHVVFSAPSVNYIFPQGLRGDERLISLESWLNILNTAGFKAKGQYYGEKPDEKYHVLITVGNQ